MKPTRGTRLGGVHHATTSLLQQLDEPGLSEALLFVIAGGIGAGVFQFHYPASSNLFLAGRHRWQDDQAYLDAAAARLGRHFDTRETGGAARAAADLRDLLRRGPVIAFVERSSLYGQATRGGRPPGEVEAYYTVGVSAHDGTAVTVHDLDATPATVPAERFAAARSRVRKFKHRLMQLQPGTTVVNRDAVLAGLRTCVAGLDDPGMGNWNRNFRLDAFATLAERMTGGGKDGWARVFPVPERRLAALRDLHRCVALDDHGGALGRAFFAAGLGEAVDAFGLSALRPVLVRYQELAERWSALADTALAGAALPGASAGEPGAGEPGAGEPGAPDGRAGTPDRAAAGEAGAADGAAPRAASEAVLTLDLAARLATDLARRMRDIVERETVALAELRTALERS